MAKGRKKKEIGLNTVDFYISAIKMGVRVSQASKDPNTKEDEK